MTMLPFLAPIVLILLFLISIGIAWLFTRFRIFKVNYFVKDPELITTGKILQKKCLREFKELYGKMLNLFPLLGIGWGVFGVLIALLVFYRKDFFEKSADVDFTIDALTAFVLGSAIILGLIIGLFLLQKASLPPSLEDAFKSRFAGLLFVVVVAGIIGATVFLELPPFGIVLLVLLAIPAFISAWFAGEFFTIFAIRQFYQARGWNYLEGQEVGTDIKGLLKRAMGVIGLVLALLAPILAINSLAGIFLKETEEGGPIGAGLTFLPDVLLAIAVFILLLGPLVSIATQPTGFLELSVNSGMYTTLSNFDWEEFNRKTRKARDIIDVRPYNQRVMAGVLALFVSFILYVSLLSLGGLVTTLDLPVETGLDKLPEALKFIEVPILLLVIGNVLWSLNEEKEIIDIAELGRKEKRDVTSWTFWILEKLYMAEYAPVHENLDELLSKPKTSQNHRTLFYKGLTLALEGKNKESEEYFKQSVEINPKFADGWMELGVINYFEGHHQEALEFLHHAAKLKRSKTVYYNIGRVFDVLDDPEQSLKAYQKALKLDPTDYKVWANIAAPLIHLGKVKEAVRAGQKALEYEPEDYVAMVNLSIALEKDGQLEASKTLQEKLLELHGDNPKVLVSLASTRMREEDIASAVELYDKLISLSGVTAANLSDLAVAFTKAGRPQDAIHVAQEFVQANPDDLRSRFLLGEILLGQNMVEQALPVFDFIANRDRTYETTMLKLGSCYGMLGRFPEALDVFMNAKDVLPTNADVWYNLALSKSMVGQTDFDDDFHKALQFARPFRPQFLTMWMQSRAKTNTLDQQWLDQIISELSQQTSLAEIYATIGNGFQVLERFAEAVKYFQMSLEQEQNLQIKDALGLLHLNLQQFAEAEAIFRSLLANQPSIGVYNNLAVSLLRSGQVEEGLIVLLEAHQDHFPEDLTILGNIAYIYAQSKLYPEAILYYEKMIALNPNDYSARNNLGKCLALADRVEDAREQFEKALNQAQIAGDTDSAKQIQEFLQQLNG